jgi:SAM-dependent methyltransferase
VHRRTPILLAIIASVSAPPLTPLATAVLHVPVPERALVVGCGEGEPALFLAREFPAVRVRGIDRSPERVRQASTRVGLDPEGRVAFKTGGPRTLPYPDDLFDLVVQLQGRPALGEIARVLRPGGHLIVARARRGGRLAAARDRLFAARLPRHRIVPLRSERAGDGNFFVGRLGEPR